MKLLIAILLIMISANAKENLDPGEVVKCLIVDERNGESNYLFEISMPKEIQFPDNQAAVKFVLRDSGKIVLDSTMMLFRRRDGSYGDSITINKNLLLGMELTIGFACNKNNYILVVTTVKDNDGNIVPRYQISEESAAK